MKHTLKITLFLLGMFLVTQLIGLAVIKSYNTPVRQVIFNETTKNYEVVNIPPKLPDWIQPPEPKTSLEFWNILGTIILSIFIATALLFLIRKFKLPAILRVWFFWVVILGIAFTFNALLVRILEGPVFLLSIVLAFPLAFYKIFERNMLVHNITELLIYPGIAAIFVPILNVWTALALLVIIAIYDVYAVWHAKFMQKMAKFQIQQIKVFTGFFLPYVAKKDRMKIEKIRSAKLNQREKTKRLKKLRIKVNLGILGGGDIAFPLIFAGVLLRAYGLPSALIITFISTFALALGILFAKEGKFYPAMLFLSPACILGWLIGLMI